MYFITACTVIRMYAGTYDGSTVLTSWRFNGRLNTKSAKISFSQWQAKNQKSENTHFSCQKKMPPKSFPTNSGILLASATSTSLQQHTTIICKKQVMIPRQLGVWCWAWGRTLHPHCAIIHSADSTMVVRVRACFWLMGNNGMIWCTLVVENQRVDSPLKSFTGLLTWTKKGFSNLLQLGACETPVLFMRQCVATP